VVQKPEGKTPLGRPWRGWESNIAVDLKGIGLWARSDDVDWMRGCLVVVPQCIAAAAVYVVAELGSLV
jgi:hypothetical protein